MHRGSMLRVSARRLAAALVLIAGLLAVLAVGALATGRAAFVSTHGISMNPLYWQGDLVVVAKAESYHVGQIVAYHGDTDGLVVLHRIIGGTAAGFVMKGDNNQSIDPTRPTPAQIVGRAVLHIPQGGAWLGRLTSPAALALVAVALTSGGGAAIQTRRRRRRAAVTRHADHSRRSPRPVFAVPPHLRGSVTTVGAVAALAAAVGVLAAALPTSAQVRTTAPGNRRVVFSYSAHVARSAAYDGTTVRSPDPVFRRLVTSVQLHAAYRGSPGTATLSARLATPDGWHSTMALAAPAPFTGTTYTATVPLDLARIAARAQAAATVTGLPADPLSVAVTLAVTSPGRAPFAATANLSLTPLQLMVRDAASSLTVRDPTPVVGTAVVPRTLSVLSYRFTVAQLRAAAAALLLLALLAAVVLALVVRVTGRCDEAAGIRRRYAPLLAAVRPITTRAELPLIEVTEFVTLAKLAERAGLLVLHWTRSGIDTFVVLDEGTTYRYRCGGTEACSGPAAEPGVRPELDPSSVASHRIRRGASRRPVTAGAEPAPATSRPGGAA